MKKLLTVFFVLPLIVLLLPLISYAFDDTLEKDLQKALHRGKSHMKKTKQKVKKGGHVKEEVAALKAYAEEIKIKHSFILERFRRRGEEVRHVSFKAEERHKEMVEGYRKAMEEYLSRIDSLPSASKQPSALSDQLKHIENLLDKILPVKKKHIFGTLPYKNLNYPLREPNQNVPITPAYKGGSKTVTADDTRDTEEAPISEEIASLAQSLNWNPVSIYEYVKNTIETEWYWGCMKGAEETLIQRSGNDCDQATLLVALLRASGFPARYVRGTIEFFASNGKPLDRVRNLTGIEDPWKIAEFFQRAGIPYKPVITGGTISNFQVEHIWVESLIPYANYRGAIIDEHGKTWLGLDTSIKVKGYTFNIPADTFQQPALSDQLSAMRDEYLGALQTQTPLEYLKEKLSAMSGQPSESYKLTRSLVPEVLNLLPASMQFTEVKITNEYTEIPDDLKHKVRFIATDSQNSELLNFELETFKLSNQKIALVYEPETVEDQQIIDYYGGLDNTPAYLVRLRPVLKVNGERVAVGTNGLPMGADMLLTIEVISPGGIEKVQRTHITGNLAAIGIVAQKAHSSWLIASEDKDAEQILYEEAINYIDRWNQAEEELASLMHLAVSRPIPAVMTIGGVVDVAHIFGTPHSFTWKGVYADANLRAIETAISRQQSATSQDQRQKLFMQLSALQGSVLEHRIFEDDFQVDSISTAKLMQLCNQPSAISCQLLTIDKTNIDSVLPGLLLDEDISEDITDAVNQDLIVRIPRTESSEPTAISYKDWTGIGYIKENPGTGESGYMLSGMLASSSPDLSGIAGGMSALLQWILDYIADKLGNPNTKEYNKDPKAGAKIVKAEVTDRQEGVVNTQLPQPLAVLVLDKNSRPVKGASVTFRVIAGGGKIDSADAYTTTTGQDGSAKATLTLGKKTSDNPVYRKISPSDEFVTQKGLNLVTASVRGASGDIPLAQPFEAFGKPGTAMEIKKALGDGNMALPNSPAGTLRAMMVDRYGNPVSNVKLVFKTIKAESRYPEVPLPSKYRTAQFYRPTDCSIPHPLFGECPSAEEVEVKTEYFGAAVGAILGNTVGTKYIVQAKNVGTNIPPVFFDLYTEGFRNRDDYIPPGIYIKYLSLVNDKGEPVNASKVGTPLKAPLTSELFMLYDDYTLEGPYACSGSPSDSCYRMKPSGIVKARPITDGTVAYTAETGGGSVTLTENLGNGKYRAGYTPGPVPMENRVSALGEATIAVPEVRFDAMVVNCNPRLPLPSFFGEAPGSDYKPLCRTAVTEYRASHVGCANGVCTLPIKNVSLKSGQQAVFDFEDPITHQLTTVAGAEQKAEYKVFGVDVQLNLEPKYIIVNEDLENAGDYRTKIDTTLKYTILPPEYNSQIADIHFYEDDGSSEGKWLNYLTGDKTQGEGKGVLLSGSSFDIQKAYFAKVILNNGSNAEIAGDRKALPVGQFKMVTDDEERKPLVGAVTDGAARIRLQLIVKRSREAFAGFSWNLVDPQIQQPTPLAERGGFLSGPELVEYVPVSFNSDGISEVVYRAPESFVRWESVEAANDKEIPVRYIQPTLDIASFLQKRKDPLTPIQLKRPPVVLVHGLWGSGDKTDQRHYSWKDFEPQFSSKQLYDITIIDYHDSNADRFIRNAKFIKLGISDALQANKKQKFATVRLDLIGNSMGGLLPREYCGNNPDECKKRIRKFVTTDSPHLGSELARLINIINQQPETSCSLLLPIMQASGKRIWEGAQSRKLKGALIDLSIGSDALQSLAIPPRVPSWSAITGVAIPGATPLTFFAHDISLNLMWVGLLHFCNKVPEGIYANLLNTVKDIFPGGSFLSDVEAIFSEENDRIVSMQSQSAFALQQVKILGVDHITVLGNSETIKKVQELLEKP